MVGMCAMKPSALQIVNSIRWSFEQAIVPELSDPLTQSYARSIMSRSSSKLCVCTMLAPVVR